MTSTAAPPVTESPRERTVGVVLTASLVLFYVISSCVWAWTDRVAPMWDQARHALDALRFLEFLHETVAGKHKWGDVGVWHDNYYVFLAYLPTAVAHEVFGPSWEVAKLVMALFWTPILLLSTGHLAKTLLGSTLAGFVAMAWIAASPLTADFSKDFLIDLPIMSMVALFLALLVQSDFLRRPWWSAACGAAAAGIVLIKAVAPGVFVVMPALLTLVHLWRTGGLGERKKGIAAALVTWAFCALPVHVRWWPEFMMARQWQQQHALEEGDPTGLLPSVIIVIKHFVDMQARGLMLPWLLAGAIQLWKPHRRWVVSGLLSFLFCELAWTWYPNKDVRFSMPGLVFLSVPAAGLFWSVTSEKRRLWWSAAVFCVAVFSTWTVQWGVSFLPQEVAIADGWRLFAQVGYLRGAPDPSPNMPLALVKPIVDDAERQAATQGRRIPLLRMDATQDEPHFGVWDMHHASYMLGHLYDVEDETPGDISQVDYLVLARCKDQPVEPPPGFVEMNALDTPQGCRAHLYRNHAMFQDETRVRAAPPMDVRYQAQHMAQTLKGVLLDATEYKAGQQVKAVFLIHVDNDRWGTNLKRTLWLGKDVALTTLETTEHGYKRGGEYVFAAAFKIPADVTEGDHALMMSVEGPDGPGHLLQAQGEQKMLVGPLHVVEAAAP